MIDSSAGEPLNGRMALIRKWPMELVDKGVTRDR